MKFIVSLICLYLFVLIALPSVRAIKLTLKANYGIQCVKDATCKTGEFVSNLCFSPVQIIPSNFLKNKETPTFNLNPKESISTYQNNYLELLLHFIWNPPRKFI